MNILLFGMLTEFLNLQFMYQYINGQIAQTNSLKTKSIFSNFKFEYVRENESFSKSILAC